MTGLLLDTHVVLWWQLEPRRLSRRAADAIDRADRLLLSPLSVWELALLEMAGKVRLDRDLASWVAALVSLSRVEVCTTTAEVALTAALLPRRGFHADPADRFIYAACAVLGHRLCTKDGPITDFAAGAGDVTTVW